MSSITFNTNGGAKGSTGSGGSATMSAPIVLTVSAGGASITNALIGTVTANKVTSITRSGVSINLVTIAPAIGQCRIVGTTLSVNAAEPLVPSEVITINQLA